MPGTIRKRGKETWEIRFDIGRESMTGKRQFRYEYVQGSKKDAEQKLIDLLHRRDTGSDIAPDKVTVAAYLDRWLRDYAKTNVAPSTLLRYQQIVARLQRLIGHHRLQDLRPAHLQSAYGALAKDGLAARTVLHHHRVLKEALGHAVQWQLVTRNVADAVKAPRPERTEMRALQPDEVHRLIDGCIDDQLRSLIEVAVGTGMRLGELLGLRWFDCDFETRVIHLVRAAQYLPTTGVTFRTPKTPKSRRSIALADDTVRVLREHRARQLEARLQLGPTYANLDLVFAGTDGGGIPTSRVSGQFSRLVKRLGIGPLRFHDLRHTAATLMLRAGVHPKIVSERLGHATVAITLDTYSHVLPDMQREAADALEAVLARR